MYRTFLFATIVLLPICLFGQNNFQILEGKVVDEVTGESLIGVHITYSNYRYGTATNVNGDFQIKISSNNIGTDILQFSYIGYKTLTVSIDEQLFTTPPESFILTPLSVDLPIVEIEDVTALTLVKKARENIKVNYKISEHTLRGFYREENIQKAPKERTILFTEGVLQVNKKQLNLNCLSLV